MAFKHNHKIPTPSTQPKYGSIPQAHKALGTAKLAGGSVSSPLKKSC